MLTLKRGIELSSLPVQFYSQCVLCALRHLQALGISGFFVSIPLSLGCLLLFSFAKRCMLLHMIKTRECGHSLSLFLEFMEVPYLLLEIKLIT